MLNREKRKNLAKEQIKDVETHQMTDNVEGTHKDISGKTVLIKKPHSSKSYDSTAERLKTSTTEKVMLTNSVLDISSHVTTDLKERKEDHLIKKKDNNVKKKNKLAETKKEQKMEKKKIKTKLFRLIHAKKEEKRSPPLITATIRGDIKKIQALLKREETEPNVRDIKRRTALHYAALLGDTSTIILLLSRGANVDAQDMEGVTPLHEAAFGGHDEIVAILLESGANAKHRDMEGNTALHKGAFSNSYNILLRLIAHEVAINPKNHLGVTPLNLAVMRDNYISAALLLYMGADPDILDNAQRSPIRATAFNGNNVLMQLLISEPFEGIVTHIDKDGLTPLQIASYRGFPICVEILLENGADIMHQDAHGQNAFHYAVLGGRKCCMWMILMNIQSRDYSIKDLINKKNIYGEAPLHLAVKKGHQRAISFLLYHNADPNVRNREGKTPLHIAPKLENDDILCRICDTLIMAGADILLRDHSGTTPVDIAEYKNIKLLCIAPITRLYNSKRLNNAFLYTKRKQKHLRKKGDYKFTDMKDSLPPIHVEHIEPIKKKKHKEKKIKKEKQIKEPPMKSPKHHLKEPPVVVPKQQDIEPTEKPTLPQKNVSDEKQDLMILCSNDEEDNIPSVMNEIHSPVMDVVPEAPSAPSIKPKPPKPVPSLKHDLMQKFHWTTLNDDTDICGTVFDDDDVIDILPQIKPVTITTLANRFKESKLYDVKKISTNNNLVSLRRIEEEEEGLLRTHSTIPKSSTTSFYLFSGPKGFLQQTSLKLALTNISLPIEEQECVKGKQLVVAKAKHLTKLLHETDGTSIPDTVVQHIMSSFPNAEQIEQLKMYKGDDFDLDDAELFCKTIILDDSRDDFLVRLSMVKLSLEYKSKIQFLEKKAKEVQDILDCTEKSQRIKRLLIWILRLGNLLNEGHYTWNLKSFEWQECNNARGFRFEEILKLSTRKNHQHNGNLLHSFVEILKEYDPDVLNLKYDFPNLSKGEVTAAFSTAPESKAWREIVNMVKEDSTILCNEISTLYEACSTPKVTFKDDPFLFKNRKFTKNVLSEVTELKGKSLMLANRYEKMHKYFGGTPGGDFLRILATFIKQLEISISELKLQQQDREAAPHRAAEAKLHLSNESGPALCRTTSQLESEMCQQKHISEGSLTALHTVISEHAIRG